MNFATNTFPPKGHDSFSDYKRLQAHTLRLLKVTHAVPPTTFPRSWHYKMTEDYLSWGSQLFTSHIRLQAFFIAICSKLTQTVKRRTGTFYYTIWVLVVVPPTEFLGDEEERQITNWLRKDKGNFLRQKYRSSVNHISEKEAKEIQ